MPPRAEESLVQFSYLPSPFSVEHIEERWGQRGIESLEVLIDFGFVERISDGFRLPNPIFQYASSERGRG